MSENRVSDIDRESERQEEMLKKQAKARKRHRRIRQAIGYVILLLLCLAGFGLYTAKKQQMEAEREALLQKTSKVEVKVQENVYKATIDLSGYVEPNDIQQAKFRSTGAVTGVMVKEGDRVKKGQTLATIDDTSQQYTLQTVRNSLREAELSGSPSQVDALKLQLHNAEMKLEYTTLVASFDGVVADIDVLEGDYFEAGDSVMTVVDLSVLKANVEIDEIDMQYIEVGQKAELTFDSMPGQVIEAYVSYVPMLGTYTSQGIGVVNVELTIDNPPAELRPGYSFEGTITHTGDVKMLLLAQAAVKTGKGGVTTVEKKVGEDETKTVEVKIKYLGEGMCQLLDGDLKAGDVLVYYRSSGQDKKVGK